MTKTFQIGQHVKIDKNSPDIRTEHRHLCDQPGKIIAKEEPPYGSCVVCGSKTYYILDTTGTVKFCGCVLRPALPDADTYRRGEVTTEELKRIIQDAKTKQPVTQT